jgi:nicotinamide mononucleotide adenylyltransferase
MYDELQSFSTTMLIEELESRNDVFALKVFKTKWAKDIFNDMGYSTTPRNMKRVQEYPYTKKLTEVTENDRRLLETSVGDALEKL